MNAEKSRIRTVAGLIIGTCLVCMLGIGCAAADTSVLSPFDTTMFYYENVSGTSGSYTYLNNPLVLTGMNVIRSESLYPEGKYTNGIEGFLLKRMDAVVTTIVYDDNGQEIIASSDTTVDIPAGSQVFFDITPTVPSNYSLYKTNGYVGLKFLPPGSLSEATTFLGTTNYSAGSANLCGPVAIDKNLTKGTWTVWAYFVPKDTPGYFSKSTPESYLNGKKYYFTIVSSTVSMSVTPDTVRVGDDFIITVTGKPNDQYILKSTAFNEKFIVKPGQNQYYDYDNHCITIGQSGSTSLRLTAKDSGSILIQICDRSTPSVVEDDVEVTITKAKITVGTEQPSYTIGDDVKLIGTNEANSELYYYLEGINKPSFTRLDKNDRNVVKQTTEGYVWETTITGSYISSLDLDTGTYTFYVSTVNDTVKDNVINRSGSTSSVGVNLVQPAIILTSIPDVVVQGNDLTVKGTAEGNPSSVTWYLFGSNKFFYNITDVGKDGSFIIEKTLDKNSFDPGQYYLVVQHPMYDKVYNVGAVRSGNDYLIVQNNTGSFIVPPYTVLFNVNDRQSANAAYALGEAINSEDIDDIAVKCSFLVTAGTTTIDPIPSEITKGLPFTVSGTTNDPNGDTISVELLSTAFTAASKQQATSASFVTLIAEPDAQGKWAVTFKTDDLNVDTYAINVLVGASSVASDTIRIVAPTTATVTPTAQATAMPTAGTVKPTEAAKSPAPFLGLLAGLGIAIICCRRRNA